MISMMNGVWISEIEKFFTTREVVSSISLFGWFHIVTILLLLLFLGIVYRYRDQISRIPTLVQNKIKWITVIVLFVNMKLYYGSMMIYGMYDWKLHLPIHMCFIAGYTLIFALIFNKRKLHKLAYFLSFIGPIPAIIFPDFKGGYEAFVFYQFIISHHLLMIMNLFFYFMVKLDIKKKDVWKTFLVSNAIFLLVTVFNYIFETNYIMSLEIPAHVVAVLPFLQTLNFPILWMEIAGISALLLAYVPVWLSSKQKKRL